MIRAMIFIVVSVVFAWISTGCGTTQVVWKKPERVLVDGCEAEEQTWTNERKGHWCKVIVWDEHPATDEACKKTCEELAAEGKR